MWHQLRGRDGRHASPIVTTFRISVVVRRYWGTGWAGVSRYVLESEGAIGVGFSELA
jgi:hypothetical protein